MSKGQQNTKTTMQLDEIVPWGRTFKEYKLMFNLSESDLNANILGCGDGPASFNAEMTSQNYSVISIDPIYLFSAQHIRQRVQETYKTIISHVAYLALKLCFLEENYSHAKNSPE